MGLDVFVDLVDQEKLAGAEGPFARFVATNEEHLLAPESDLHVGDLFSNFLLRNQDGDESKTGKDLSRRKIFQLLLDQPYYVTFFSGMSSSSSLTTSRPLCKS